MTTTTTATVATTMTARRLLTADGEIAYPVVRVRDGRIESIEAGEPSESMETLTPAFFDVHVHGACSFDLMHADTEQIRKVSRYLGTRGVGHYLPTTVTGPMDSTLRALERLADAIEAAEGGGAPDAGAVPLGIHLEGPFVSALKRGVHPAADVLAPSLAQFDRLQAAARGRIALMTIAPELPEALEVIAHASGQGVRVSLGHSNATAAEASAGIAAGATSATHLFNAMRAIDHREPGIAGEVLVRDEVYAELICDGVHVAPAMAQMWLRMKGERRGILITDGMAATGMGDGVYMLGELAVRVQGGVCLWEGKLAGSVLTMDAAVANVQRFTGTSLATAVRLASHNPARMMGMEDKVALKPGQPANFNVYDAAGVRVAGVWHGQRVGVRSGSGEL